MRKLAETLCVASGVIVFQRVMVVTCYLSLDLFRITFCHLPFQSKWLYVGTVRGNVHIVGIESFVISGYVINWNKAIEM